MRIGQLAVALLAFALLAGAFQRGTGQEATGSGAVGQEASAASSDPALEADVSRIASQLRCPVCEALSIEDSPTELAREMRDVIRDQLAAGRTPDQVKAYFVDNYGEWVLLEPEASGFNLLVYVLPLLAVLGGAGLVVASVRRWSRAGVAQGEPSRAGADD